MLSNQRPFRWMILPVMLLAFAAGGCQTNPDTGRSQFIVMSPEEELSLGEEAQPEFIKSYGGEVESEALKKYVTDIGLNLASQSYRPDLPWEFHVVDSAVINAFALPGGKVFMSRGLLEKMDNEAQLAGVLGHEVGHVTAKHVNDRMANAMAVQGVLAGIGLASQTSDQAWLGALGVGAEFGGSVYLLKYNRDQEHESDELGVKYMAKCGYNPMGQVQVMEILAREAGSGGTIEMLSTHPHPESRVERLRGIIEMEYPEYADSQDGFFADRFAQIAKAELQKLPPPKHTGEEQQAAAH